MNYGKRDTLSPEASARPWKGQSWPRSSTGRSSLVEPLPHHISCEALHVNFRAEPSAIVNLLPPGLEPLETGDGWVMIAEMAKVSTSNTEQMWRDPARSSYNECVLGFYCRFGDKVGRYSALVWVDRDWSLGMGAIFGWGKRLGTIDRTRHQPTNPAFAGKASHTLGGTVSRYGRRVLDMSVSFEDGGQPLSALPGHAASTFLYRYIASPGPGVADIEQLFELGFTNVSMSGIQSGTGSLAFGDAEDEDLDLLGQVEVTGGFAYQRGWTTDRTAHLLQDFAAG